MTDIKEILGTVNAKNAKTLLNDLRVNVIASDLIPLNRQIPDSRPSACRFLEYPHDLPTVSIVIPFYNEWPSLLLRTVHSILNRTPPNILKEIVLVDDASSFPSLKQELDEYIAKQFSNDLVKILHLSTRKGLVGARLAGFELITGDTVSFFDSHMEVNVHWVEPLLVELLKNRKTVAVGHLDYIDAVSLRYDFDSGYKTRYGFDWRLIFFETFFRKDHLQTRSETDAIPGVVMVGTGFVIDVQFFKDIGTYDSGMKIWGGENIDLAWRIWMCGGQLVHLPCSKIGHIARTQPYSFPEGRDRTELFNYKRSAEVWMGPYKKYVYENHPEMRHMDVGSLTERFEIKKRMQCKDFDWFLTNIWPELFAFDLNVTAWGNAKNEATGLCLDNKEYLFSNPEELGSNTCTYSPSTQMFSVTEEGELRTILQCVTVHKVDMDYTVYLESCLDGPPSWWSHVRDGPLKHVESGLCLETKKSGKVFLEQCDRSKRQKWVFSEYPHPFGKANKSVFRRKPRRL